MSVPAEVAVKFAQSKPYVQWVGDRVRDVVLGFSEDRGYAFAGRTKAPTSLAEKIETGRFSRWSELDDRYACTIVVPTLADEPGVISFLESRFDVVTVKRRGATLKDPAVFRFDSTRVVARMKSSEVDETGMAGRVQFEVQVRTAFEHAWSATTHKLAYKGARIDWRRLRLAAQLKASVEQLDLLVAGYDGVSDLISSSDWPELRAKSRIEELFRGAIEAGRIPSEAAPDSWMRFCENVYNLVKQIVRSKGGRADRVTKRVLRTVEEALPERDQDFPRSVSMYQFVFGVLAASDDMLPAEFERYYPLVTSSLRDLYPATAKFENTFDLELEAV